MIANKRFDFEWEQNTSNVAVYWDFDNIQIALSRFRDSANRGSGADGKRGYLKPNGEVNIGAIMSHIGTSGRVVINRAYADWRGMSCYTDDLIGHCIDTIHVLPPKRQAQGRKGKNGADIRMALDALEDCIRFPKLTDFVVISGDSDFLALCQRLRQFGKNIIGIGVRESAGDRWVTACDKFIFYRDLVASSSRAFDRSLVADAPSAGA